MSDLYRGTIAYDEPLRVRCDAGTGKRNDPEHYRTWKRAWRQKKREKYNAYMREYMREYRRRNPDLRKKKLI
jgi:hypothetical protein